MDKEKNPETFMLRYSDYLLGLYVLVSSVIARFAIPMVAALVVTPNLFIVPYLVGAGIICTFSKTFYGKNKSVKFLIGFFSGCLFLHSLFVLTEFSGYRIDMAIFDAIIVATMMIGFLKDGLDRKAQTKGKTGFLKSERANLTKCGTSLLLPVVELLVILAIGGLVFYIPKISLPFPLVSFDHGVGQETILPVTRLLNDGVLDVAKARALPVILQAIVCSLSGVPIFNLSWAAPLATSLVFSLSMFSVAFCITKNKVAAIATAMLAILANSGYGFFFDSVYFIFRYSTILTAVFPLVIQEVYSHFSKAKAEVQRKPLVLLSAGTVLLIGVFFVYVLLQPPFLTSFFTENEFLRPFLILIFLSFVLVGSTKIKNGEPARSFVRFLSLFVAFALAMDLFRPVLYIAFIFLFLFLFLLAQTNTSRVKSFRSLVGGITVPWFTRMNLLRIVEAIMFSWVLLCLTGYVNFMDISVLGIGSISTVIKSQALLNANSAEVMTIFLLLCVPLIFSWNMGEFAFGFASLASLSVYFLPVAETYYLHNVSNIFMGFVIGVGLFKILDQFSQFIRIPARTLRLKVSRRSFITVVGLSMTVIVLIPMVGAAITRFTWVGAGTYPSFLRDYESRAIDEYISRLPEDVRIISDPFTMIAFTSLTGRVGLVEHGMAPLGEQYKSIDTIMTIWNDVFHGHSSSAIASAIMKFQYSIPSDEERYVARTQTGLNLSKFIVVISARTSWWLDNNDPLGYYTLFPSYNVSLSHIIQFLDLSYFNLTYKIDRELYIFTFEKGNNSSYVVTKDHLFEEPQTAFWEVTYYGEGNISLILTQTNASTDQTQPDDYLDIKPTPGNYESWGLYHTYASCTNLSKYQLVILPFYGSATNTTYYFSLDGPTPNDRTIFLFRDDFIGWNSLSFSLDSPTATEERPDLARIVRITFSPFILHTQDYTPYIPGELLLGPIILLRVDW